MSAEPTSSIRGSWAKVDGPAKRGTWGLSTWPTWSPSTMRGRESGMRLALRELLDGLRLGLAVADDLPVGRGVRVLDDLRRRALPRRHQARSVGPEDVARLRGEEQHREVEHGGQAERHRQADVHTARGAAEPAPGERRGKRKQ